MDIDGVADGVGDVDGVAGVECDPDACGSPHSPANAEAVVPHVRHNGAALAWV